MERDHFPRSDVMVHGVHRAPNTTNSVMSNGPYIGVSYW